MTIVMRPTCWHQNFGPNGLSAPAQGLFLNVFSSITADFNISSAIRWAIQDQWSSGLFFSQQLMACNDRCSHKLLQRNSPFIFSKQNVFDSIWQDIQDISVADTAFWTILDHVSDTAFCLYFQLWPLFSLVSDRLGGQVSEQKDAGTLDMVKKPIKSFCRTCRYSILYCGRRHIMSPHWREIVIGVPLALALALVSVLALMWHFHDVSWNSGRILTKLWWIYHWNRVKSWSELFTGDTSNWQ